MGKSHAAGILTGNSLDPLFCVVERSRNRDPTVVEDIRAISKSPNRPDTKKLSTSHPEYNCCECGETTSVCTSGGESRVSAMDVGTLVTLDFG